MRILSAAILLSAPIAFASCGGGDSSTGTTQSIEASEAAAPKKKTKPDVAVPAGAPPKKLVIENVETGSGPVAKAGDTVTVQYVGVNYETGQEFDSSWSRSEPFRFNLGAGEVIPGWDQGVAGMKVGGRRQLTVPPQLGYGEAGAPPAIPPNETLVFVVDLLAVE